MLIIIGIIILVVIILALFFIKIPFEISVSKTMNISKEKIFNRVINFKTWAEWSPWILHEKNVDLKYSSKVTEEGGYYTWEGKKIGSGKMTHNTITKNEKIEQTVEFLKPYKSTSKVTWLFESQEDNTTKVTWQMKGNMPLFLKTMIAKMKNFITKDYKVGLILLNQILDKKADRIEVDFIGEEIFGKDAILYQSFQGTTEEMKQAMEETYPKLEKYCSDNEIEVVSQPLAVYHKVQPLVKMDIAIPIKKKSIKDKSFQIKKLSATKYFRMDFKGKYEFLEEAWHIAFSHFRVNKMKFKSSKPCLEVYLNESKNKNELRTSIYIAKK